ncbi:MAG TPA: hypothetical protein VFZ17_15175 [Acidimicrobiia bacterium]|nr:hypothetical protein [Acidimicrobiia bacterium]
MTTAHRHVLRATAACAVASLIAVALCITTVATASAGASRASIGVGITGPAGLTATVNARGLRHVAALAEDAQGRIWAATAVGSTDDADAVYVVDDAGAAPRLVIDDVETPLGLVWIDDALYVARRGGVERYAAFDGTSFGEHHAVLTLAPGGGDGDVGEVNGLAVGPDGRLVVGVSAPCDSCTPSSPWSASIVTFLPDGSDARVLATGIRAAVGLAFFPGTDDLFATMNQRDDLGARTPGDWLARVEDGQSWGFPACYGQAKAACADVPEPVAVLGKHAAVSGVTILSGELGDAVGTGAAVAEWTTGKVKLVALHATNDGYEGTTTSFLSGFEHPVAVLRTSDSALLVGDWGTGRIVRVTATP